MDYVYVVQKLRLPVKLERGGAKGQQARASSKRSEEELSGHAYVA